MLAGWVGGGCAESAVRSEALMCLETERPRLIIVDMSDEQLGVGMPCGGTMEIFIEPVLPNPELLIVGHGRIAETLAALGDMMGFSITVNDPAAERSAFPRAQKLVTEDFDLEMCIRDSLTTIHAPWMRPSAATAKSSCYSLPTMAA